MTTPVVFLPLPTTTFERLCFARCQVLESACDFGQPLVLLLPSPVYDLSRRPASLDLSGTSLRKRRISSQRYVCVLFLLE